MYHLLYRVPRFSILANLSSSSWFKIFLIAHAVIWTLLPYFTRQSLHHDVLEGIAQGLQFQWGYSKHPFLSMWVLAYLWKLFEHQEFFLYAFAQGLIVLSLIYVWRLNRILLPLNQAFMASVSLECFSYYGLDAHILTPDSFQIPLWVMSIYYFYQALEQNRWQDWCVLGLISALGVMVKYQFLILW
jgi:4-amino-4-deoxy-L-arabinose transferase-like glycosyltransferase